MRIEGLSPLLCLPTTGKVGRCYPLAVTLTLQGQQILPLPVRPEAFCELYLALASVSQPLWTWCLALEHSPQSTTPLFLPQIQSISLTWTRGGEAFPATPLSSIAVATVFKMTQIFKHDLTFAPPQEKGAWFVRFLYVYNVLSPCEHNLAKELLRV